MNAASLGSILVAMANYARERAEQRRDFLGPNNTELLYAISHMLLYGAHRCLEEMQEHQVKEDA